MAGATSLIQLILKKWGDDIAGAAKELEEKVGFPESVANRIATGELPMDAESVAARRIEQGYGDAPQYHATDSDFVEFRPSARGKMGRGVYTSPDTGYVGKYTPERSGANVKEVYLRGDRVKRHEQSDIYPDYFSGGMSEDEMIGTMAGDGVRHVDGYSGDTLLETSTPNPSDIRSSGAAFDPQYTGPNIMGGATVPLLAATAAGTGGVLAAPILMGDKEKPTTPEERGFKSWEEVSRDPTAPLPAPTWGEAMGKAGSNLMYLLGMPMTGLQGLARGGYGLLTGEGLTEAAAQAGNTMDVGWKDGLLDVSGMNPDKGADQAEAFVTEKTGDESLGWLAKMGLLFGGI